MRLPAEWLAALGVAEGEAAHGHVSGGRLVLTPPRGIRDVQTELGDLARELQGLRDRISDVAHELPEPPEAMLRAEEPASVEADVLGTLECILNDDLDPVIRKLRAAAAVTAEQLREYWQRTRPGLP